MGKKVLSAAYVRDCHSIIEEKFICQYPDYFPRIWYWYPWAVAAITLCAVR